MRTKTKLLKYLSFIIFFAVVSPLSAQLLPDFVDETLNTSLSKPVGITFDKVGKAYVWEQSGLVHILDTTGVLLNSPLIDIREEVSEFVDHGLLGFALDPEFLNNGYIYLLYVVDPHHLFNFGTPDYDPNTTIINEATIGRITRYTADSNNNFESIIPSSRLVLLGDSADNGFPIVASSHGVGTLTFGTDGTLIASCGETGSFVSSDAGNHPDSFYEKALQDGIIRVAENVGAYRSQMLNSLGGKILRLDPATGLGLASNPYYDPQLPNSTASKVWARGLRNPFRIYLDPSTGSHNPEDGDPGVIFIGDVGASRWEELNIATEGGLNFGWPIYEGMTVKNAFGNLIREHQNAPNPLFNQGGCAQEFFTFHDLITQPNDQVAPTLLNSCDGSFPIPDEVFPSIHTRPTIAWLNHNQMTDSVALIPTFNATGEATVLEIENPDADVEGIHFNGSSSITGFYYEGTNFPEEFHGRYFHADFDGWISIFDFNNNYKLTKVDTFATAVKGLVDLEVSPKDGCIYYVKVIEGPSIHRICFGGDPPPVAIAKSNNNFGPSPLTVTLDASDSYHPKGYPITIEWQLPDGSTSDQAIFDYNFSTNGDTPTGLTVILEVKDSTGNIATDELIISLNNTPPNVEITSIEDGDLYPISDFTYLPLRANISDLEHSEEELTYEWQTFLYHNTHNHAGPVSSNIEAYALLEPVGCNGETYWYRVELTVSDPAGLFTKKSVEVFPNCGTPFGQNIILTGEAKIDQNILSWNNADQSNISTYEIQRSENNTDFISIASLEVNANSLYSYEDKNPIWGINKYRIKAVTNNDIYDYSNKISLDFPGETYFSVFPNPSAGLINVEVKESNGSITFNLYDGGGKLVLTEKWFDDIMDGIEKKILLNTIADGIYHYQIDNGISTFHGSILVIN